LLNAYGPTESTNPGTNAMLDVLPAAEVPSGAPVPNTVAYVVDGHGQPAPVGVPGELLVGGECLARGYVGASALTAERFRPNPFGPGRVYRTGDKVRRRPDGQLEFIGRMDGQVKVRGFRIELGEVESALREHPNVRDVVVVARADAPGDARLVAYMVGDVPPNELRAHLSERIPVYMFPAQFVTLAALPMTTNGKIDRRALPAPDAAERAPYVAPTTAAERTMCAIAAELLRTPRVGIHDNFFAIGGHSLLATQFVSRVRNTLHVNLEIAALFRHPTIAELSRAFFQGWVDGEI
jgi:acyl-coenzyme A synthetase/AMP-(fatty) acid ligase